MRPFSQADRASPPQSMANRIAEMVCKDAFTCCVGPASDACDHAGRDKAALGRLIYARRAQSWTLVTRGPLSANDCLGAAQSAQCFAKAVGVSAAPSKWER